MTAAEEQRPPTAVELTPAGRERRRRRLRLLVALTGGLALVGGLLGYLGARDHWLADVLGDHEGGARSWVGLALIVLGVALEVWGLVRALRTGASNATWNSPLHDLSRQRRRELRNQVRGRTPLDPDSAPVCRDFAHAMIRDHRRLTPVVLGLCLMILGQTLQHSGLIWRTYLLAAALPLVASLLVGRRDTRSARAFLLAHPADGSEET